MKEFISHSQNDTYEIAREFASHLKGGEVVAFKGGLGMGKTAFVHGVASFFGLENLVSSPTFSIVNDYGGKPHIYHFDMYRVESWDSLYSTGYFDYISPDSVLFVEWSENIEGVLENDTIFIEIKKGENDNDRIITVEGGEY